jgi:hypothetical protein
MAKEKCPKCKKVIEVRHYTDGTTAKWDKRKASKIEKAIDKKLWGFETDRWETHKCKKEKK